LATRHQAWAERCSVMPWETLLELRQNAKGPSEQDDESQTDLPLG
jgi:hypothetical protein